MFRVPTNGTLQPAWTAISTIVHDHIPNNFIRICKIVWTLVLELAGEEYNEVSILAMGVVLACFFVGCCRKTTTEMSVSSRPSAYLMLHRWCSHSYFKGITLYQILLRLKLPMARFSLLLVIMLEAAFHGHWSIRVRTASCLLSPFSIFHLSSLADFYFTLFLLTC